MTPIEQTLKNLRTNNFEAYRVATPQEACELVFTKILPRLNFTTVSYADSMTMQATGILGKLREETGITMIETFSPDYSPQQRLDKRKAALLADVFFTGTNALTVSGQLVNLDMIGNRVGAITFGPHDVILFIGKNKIVKNIEQARRRIKTISAPKNAIRHSRFHLPCQKTETCYDCHSKDRICNSWSITEKSYPAGRIKIILIDQVLGL